MYICVCVYIFIYLCMNILVYIDNMYIHTHIHTYMIYKYILISISHQEKISIYLDSDRLRILVTGGSGFVGSHLVDRLMMAGHEVRFILIYLGFSENSFCKLSYCILL
jgi:hypothetical protein